MRALASIQGLWSGWGQSQAIVSCYKQINHKRQFGHLRQLSIWKYNSLAFIDQFDIGWHPHAKVGIGDPCL